MFHCTKVMIFGVELENVALEALRRCDISQLSLVVADLALCVRAADLQAGEYVRSHRTHY